MKDRGFVGEAVQDAIFLYIRSPANSDGANISPQYSPGPNITSGPNFDSTNQYSVGVDKGFRMDKRPPVFKFIPCHFYRS
jgi:hypothetical protein